MTVWGYLSISEGLWDLLYQFPTEEFRVPSHSGNQGTPGKWGSIVPVRENSGKTHTQIQGKFRELVRVTQKGKVFASLGYVRLVPSVQVVFID